MNSPEAVRYDLALGSFEIVVCDGFVTGLYTAAEHLRPDGHSSSLSDAAAEQLAEYFDGRRHTFDLPLKLSGTSFQQQVQRALLTIPYGETRSYKYIAEQISNPHACRAVGMAANRNPLMIFVPCHRMIGSDGSLTGFGAGLELKRELLELERKYSSAK